MKKIYAIGESLVDIIFRKGEPQTAKPGGSMLNTVVSLGRIGLPVSFITEYAADEVGKIIDSFLGANGVDTNYVSKYKNGKTALALAFLDENNDASYTFYKDYPANRLQKKMPELSDNDILLFGSIYSVTPEIREKLIGFISRARAGGALIIYDPNFRKAHLSQIDELRPLITENMGLADIIRGSDEDFRNIFGAGSPDEAWEMVSRYCGCLIYTASSSGVFVRSNGYSGMFPVKKIKPVSTIGAGDNFNAGLIASLYERETGAGGPEQLGADVWKSIISTAVSFASEVCISYDNYIGEAFARRYRSASRDQM